jgi:hypothetical protein
VGYLDLYSYEKLVAKRKTAPIGFSVDSLSYKTNRTLTLGKNQNGAALHVFIKDSVLHAHEYLEFPGGDYFTVSWHSGTISPAVLNPSFYAIPLATDEEFAELMLRFSHPLEFAEWNAGVNMVEEQVSGYFGRIFRME